MPNTFDGQTYEPEHDEDRLGKQLERVRQLVLDGEWRTLDEIGAHSGAPPASVSARLRDLRKERFGQYNVERRRRGAPKDGLWEYRINGKLPDEEPVFPSDRAALVSALQTGPEASVLAAAREYAETCKNTDDPAEVQSALDRLTRAALDL